MEKRKQQLQKPVVYGLITRYNYALELKKDLEAKKEELLRLKVNLKSL